MKIKFSRFVFFAIFFLINSGYSKAEQSLGLEGIIAKMKVELNLSEEQVKAIKPFLKQNLLQRQRYLESIEGDALTNKTAVKGAIYKFKEDLNQNLNKVLSKEQFEKWIEKQNLKERLNRDKVNYKEYLQEGAALTPQGGSIQF